MLPVSDKAPLEQAAEAYQQAQAALNNGNTLEAIGLSEQALDHIRLLTHPSSTRDKLHIQIILFLLETMRMRLRVKSDDDNQSTVLDLALEAETVAVRLNEPSLLSQVRQVKGRILISSGDIPAALATLRDALEIARTSGDSLIEFTALSSLGHQWIKANLREGLDMLYNANSFYETHLRTTEGDVKPLLLTLRTRLGVGEFDRGNYGDALLWLKESVETARQLHMREDLFMLLNFIAQLYIATGLFEKAEASLVEATHILSDAERPNPWNGNNLALLGKLYLEWGRIQDAEAPIVKGLAESEAAWNAELISLVRNYYAELLMHPQYEKRSPDEAEKQLRLNVAECEKAVIHRSAILALSLLGQLKLARGSLDDALDTSQQAVVRLEKLGTMPALRTEEIYFNHYRVLKAVGRLDQSAKYLMEAHKTLQEKWTTIAGDENKKIFLERVPLNRAILDAVKAKD